MKKIRKENLIWLIPLLILNIISMLNMYNAKYISTIYNNALIKQIIWFTIGYVIILIMNKIKVKNLFKYSIYFYIFSTVLLVLVLFLGKDIKGAKCWFSIFGISFQPSELMKIALILFGIQILEKSSKNTFKEQIILIMKLTIITLIPSVLVFLEPDTGAIINYLIILLVLFFSAKLNKWWYILGFGLIIILTSLFFVSYFFYQDTLIKLIGTSIFYRMDRIINFTNGSGYQLENALINIGASAFFKFNIKDILLYIPEAPTDFIFSFSIGNFGIFSALLIVLSYLIINFYLFYKAKKLKNNKYKLFIYSYLSILIFHEIYNIFMNLGLLPIMGIPLPFLSYGGTSTIINYLFLGIIIKMLKEKNI